MFNNNSAFYRIIIHTVGVLFLIGILGSTALGDEGLFSTVVQALYVATFGPVSETESSESGGILPPPPPETMTGGGGENPPPPDTLQ